MLNIADDVKHYAYFYSKYILLEFNTNNAHRYAKKITETNKSNKLILITRIYKLDMYIYTVK